MKTFEQFNEAVRWYKHGKLDPREELDQDESQYDEVDEVWAIFKITQGKKLFLTSLNANGSFLTFKVNKYSDDEVLKFTLEQAKELIDKNNKIFGLPFRSSSDRMVRIVNNKGIQLTIGEFDKLWKRV